MSVIESKKFYKLTTEDNRHNGFEYKEGLNICPDWDPDATCSMGLYFTDSENWYNWVQYNDKKMFWIWDCEPLNGEFVRESRGKYKAAKIILTNRRTIKEYLQSIGTPYDIVKIHPQFIKYIDNPSDELIQHLIIDNKNHLDKVYSLMMFIKSPSQEIQEAVLSKYGPAAFQYIQNPSEETRNMYNQQIDYLSKLEDVDEQKQYIRKSIHNIKYINNLSSDMQICILNYHLKYIPYIKNLDDNLKFVAITNLLSRFDRYSTKTNEFINNNLTDKIIEQLDESCIRKLFRIPETKEHVISYFLRLRLRKRD